MAFFIPHTPSPGWFGQPAAPTSVTSIAKDSGATVSFYAPSDIGMSAISSYTVTPYAAGVAQTPTTVPVASLTSITTGPGAPGPSALQAAVTGLTNSTSYTFTVKATNGSGAGPESVASGANTPLSGLVFGDDFNGPSGGPIDPEWWVYDRCGYLAQSEVEYYLPAQCHLGGDSYLHLDALHQSYTGPGYPSAGGGNVTQPWRSGACQSNTRTYTPASGNTMTFEAMQQPCSQSGSSQGMWPGLFWLEGQDYLTAWKTDPYQATWDLTGKAEIDIAEFNPGYNNAEYLASVMCNDPGWDSVLVSNLPDVTAAMHSYSVRWKPGVSIHWYFDGTETRPAVTSGVPTSGCSFFLLLYLQIKSGNTVNSDTCLIDYVRVYDQNLG
jgi:Fibronectin type III domain